MQKEFDVKDIHYRSIRRSNFNEVAGPGLREMEIIRKHENMKREWKEKEVLEISENRKLLKKIKIRAMKTE